MDFGISYAKPVHIVGEGTLETSGSNYVIVKHMKRYRLLWVSGLLVLLSLVLCTTMVYGALSSNLTLYYPFDGDTNNVITGSPNATNDGADLVAGKLGSGSYRFVAANTDDMFIPAVSSLSFGNGVTDTPFTVQMWINMTTTASPQMILSKWNGGALFEYYFAINATGAPNTVLYNSTGTNNIESDGDFKFNNSIWYHMVVTYNGNRTASGMRYYLNGQVLTRHNLVGALPYTAMNFLGIDMFLGMRGANGSGTLFLDGTLDEVSIWRRNLSSTEITSLYNNGAGCAYPFSACETVGSTPGIHLNAYDLFSNASVDNFTFSITNSTFGRTNTSSSGLATLFNLSLTGTYNVTVNITSRDYYNETFQVVFNGTSQSDSSNNTVLVLRAFPYIRLFTPTFTGNVTGGYMATMNVSLNMTCPSGVNATLFRFINGTGTPIGPSCVNRTVITYASTYTHPYEGNFSFQWGINSTLGNFLNATTAIFNFTSDLNAPVITILNITSAEGFINGTTNITMQCTDTISPTLEYTLTFNGVVTARQNVTAGSTIVNTTTAAEGDNTLVGRCRDALYTTTNTTTLSIYFRLLALIDERNNVPFNLANVTSARVYFDDNSSFYDFKATNRTTVNFTGLGTTKLRFELGYSSGAIVTRYVDIALEPGVLRVCANPEGVTHYEQLIVSSSQRPVTVRNIFSQCVIAQDYTRFAFQDAFSLRMFTIAMPYYMYTEDGGEQTFLAAIDGGLQQSYINLDTLEFSQQEYDLNILGTSMSFRKIGNDTIEIYYNNLRQEIASLTATIYRMDNATSLFSTSTFSNPNEWTIYFNYSAISGINDTVQFKIDLSGLKTNGDPVDETFYFNIFGSSGKFRAPFAFVIAFLLMLFGLSFAASNLTFSWFGIIILLMVQVILGMAVATWYITFAQAIDAILLVYIFIALIQKNPGQVS